jgi:hypothetical protein
MIVPNGFAVAEAIAATCPVHCERVAVILFAASAPARVHVDHVATETVADCRRLHPLRRRCCRSAFGSCSCESFEKIHRRLCVHHEICWPLSHTVAELFKEQLGEAHAVAQWQVGTAVDDVALAEDHPQPV